MCQIAATLARMCARPLGRIGLCESNKFLAKKTHECFQIEKFKKRTVTDFGSNKKKFLFANACRHCHDDKMCILGLSKNLSNGFFFLVSVEVGIACAVCYSMNMKYVNM